MTHWFDIGVNMPDKRLPLEEVINGAEAQDVLGIVLIGTDVEQSQQALELTRDASAVHLAATAGVHPHNAKDVKQGYIEELRQLASAQNVVAIGECGLDFNRNFSPADAQLRVFEQQLELACELGLPVYLHERDAFEPQIRLLNQYAPRLKGAIVHCFTGSKQQAEAYLQLGFSIGITGWVCDPKRGDALREALSVIPLDRLLLETDAPYLMPKTLKTKSRNNQPANLPHIAQEVAAIKKVDIQYLKQCCWRNSINFFELESDFAG
ncbi:TatD family hydrolase [Aliiglaciecola litoralis]|uniref:3'-5' ssDNA/RNA exonuclease TatD n=1 Tax=Aliiglaciecola litoralis TaxID=582857 RepID=A0ABP3WP40_9ALTE